MKKLKIWYNARSATEKGALITGMFLLVITLLTIAHQRSELNSDNTKLREDLQKKEENLKEKDLEIVRIVGERNQLETKFAIFVSAADHSYPELPAEQRLERFSKELEKLLNSTKEGDKLILLEVGHVLDAVETLGQQLLPTGDRVLSASVVELLSKTLKAFSEYQVDVTSLMGDGEAHTLADQIKGIFDSAGWQVNGVNQALFSRPVRRLIIKVDKPPPEALGRAIVHLFNDLGYAPKAILDPKMGEKTIKIIVGKK